VSPQVGIQFKHFVDTPAQTSLTCSAIEPVIDERLISGAEGATNMRYRSGPDMLI